MARREVVQEEFLEEKLPILKTECTLARPKKKKSVCAWSDRLEKEVDQGCRQKIKHIVHI